MGFFTDLLDAFFGGPGPTLRRDPGHVEDVTVRLKDGSTTQIDHIYVNRFGIFVVEEKDYGAWIFGKENDKTWTAVYPGGSQKHAFQNPLRQNHRHVMALVETLRFRKSDIEKRIFSVVRFSGRATLKTKEHLPHSVIQGSVQEYMASKGKPVFTKEQVQNILAAIEESTLPHDDWVERHHTSQAHIESLERRHHGTKCPRCGWSLVRRKRPDGSTFIGCAQHPECPYLRKGA